MLDPQLVTKVRGILLELVNNLTSWASLSLHLILFKFFILFLITTYLKSLCFCSLNFFSISSHFQEAFEAMVEEINTLQKNYT